MTRDVLKRSVLRAGDSEVSYALGVMRVWSLVAAINPEMMISKGTADGDKETATDFVYEGTGDLHVPT